MDEKAKQFGAVQAAPAVSATDGQLVVKCMTGDRQSFDELIARYQRQAVAVAYRLLGNTQDALEVTQDAFLKAFSSLKTLQKPEAFGGWLMRIVSNLSLNYRRSRKLRTQLPLDDMLGPADQPESGGSEWMARDVEPGHRLESQEMGVRLKEALAQLPGETAAGDRDVYDRRNAAEAGGRGDGMFGGGGEVACVSGTEEVERDDEEIIGSCQLLVASCQ